MEIESKNETKKSLKWFLIGRFLITMLFIYVSVQSLGILYNSLILPTMSAILADQQVSVTAKGSPVLLILQMLLYVMTSFLPDGLGGYAQRVIGQHVGGSFQIAVDSPLFSGLRGVVLRLLIIIMFLALIFVSVLPYLVGAFYYYRTVSKKVNELMEEEKAQQIAYERERNLLLSDIAHDIKTPITTLCSYSKALSDDLVQGDKRQEYLDTIYHKSMRMNELITLLFEYVKMDSSGFELHREDCDLGEVLRECIAALYTDFEERKITLRMEIPEIPTPYSTDKVQMMRAVTNLLSNTIRYGKNGGKTFVQLKEYTITVADDGEQIDDELAKHIFEPFSRGDKARSTKGGSGLGLSIASKIVQMHGGELKLNRDYGHGYTKAFQIILSIED
ncbi:MAG: HAMP domain-containing histidine kinase [Lachnospiraceae bacterium]|nr:HAMP domain-containing histidine kinase [Lachnospiraceae bacterium]